MKALAKGTPVRVVNPDVIGVIIRTETNGDDFGYRVGIGKELEVDDVEVQYDPEDKTKETGRKSVKRKGYEHERFFPLHEVQQFLPLPLGALLSISLSGDKGTCGSQIDAAVKHPMLSDGLKYLVGSLPGTHAAGSVSLMASGAFSMSLTTWTAEAK